MSRKRRPGRPKGSKNKRKSSGKKGLYTKPKHKYLADMIKTDSPEHSRKSVRDLRKEYREAKTRAKKRRIAHATGEAANRLEVRLRKQSGKKYNQTKDSYSAFKGAADSFWHQYEMSYGKK